MANELVHAFDGTTLRAEVAAWRHSGARIGIVPTMGNLHAGHYALIEAARTQCDRVIASVFVNPTQFGPNEDFSSYPRTLDADAEGLARAGCDLLFAPGVEVMYPFGVEASVRVRVPVVSDGLCGAFRPGHFDGVATVVAKLLQWAQADVAFFGRKDLQQLRVIERMVRDLAMPVAVVGIDTVREPDGLAMSSRNQYLTAEERALAPEIHRSLQTMRRRIGEGVAFDLVEQEARDHLSQRGFRVDYAAIRNDKDLSLPVPGDGERRVALTAARLGRARLIDNLLI